MEDFTVKIVEKEPIFRFSACCDELIIYYEDIVTSEVGQVWSVPDQDSPVNRQVWWDNELTMIYKDDDGALLRWVEGHEYKNPDDIRWEVYYTTEFIYVKFH